MKQSEFPFMQELLTPIEKILQLIGEQSRNEFDVAFAKVLQAL